MIISFLKSKLLNEDLVYYFFKNSFEKWITVFFLFQACVIGYYSSTFLFVLFTGDLYAWDCFVVHCWI